MKIHVRHPQRVTPNDGSPPFTLDPGDYDVDEAVATDALRFLGIDAADDEAQAVQDALNATEATTDSLEDLPVPELRTIATAWDIPGRSSMNKEELIAAITAAEGSQ